MKYATKADLDAGGRVKLKLISEKEDGTEWINVA
jgi:hypothetical protein